MQTIPDPINDLDFLLKMFPFSSPFLVFDSEFLPYIYEDPPFHMLLRRVFVVVVGHEIPLRSSQFWRWRRRLRHVCHLPGDVEWKVPSCIFNSPVEFLHFFLQKCEFTGG